MNAGEVFGMEEIVTCHPIRVIRAKALSPVVAYTCSKHSLLKKMDRSDVRQLIDVCKQYTDFDKVGVELAHQMAELRRKTENLLDATQTSGSVV